MLINNINKDSTYDDIYKELLDYIPFSCQTWNDGMKLLDCNKATLSLFGVLDKDEYLKNFESFSPKYQPDGRLSTEKAVEKLKRALETGTERFEWMHQKKDGEPIPAEIILIRMKYGDRYRLLVCCRDLRALKDTIAMMKQLEIYAFTDSVTGIFNRRYFMDKAEAVFTVQSILSNNVAIMMIDLDLFKLVNDNYGHLAGDHILYSVAQVIKNTLRPEDLLARYGGEEFIVLAQSDRQSAHRLAERIRMRIENEEFIYNDKRIIITVSIGVAIKENDSMSLYDCISAADVFMYMAKANGRNRVISADDSL